MNKIKIVLNSLDIKEVCLSVTGQYLPNKTTVETSSNDIIITVENDSYQDKIYGKEIQSKFYFARHELIFKEVPLINYYEEFFSCGTELNFN